MEQRQRPLDAAAPARVRLASGAVPPGDDRPGPAVALVRAALAETPPGPEWTTQRALALAVALGDGGARPGAGGTADLWEALATLAAADLGIARTVEPHLDALAILEQERGAAGDDGARGVDTHAGGAAARTWGVFAAEGGGDPLTAVADADGPDAVRLSGTKPWCSLAGSLTHALITAAVDDGSRGLFAVDLRQPGVEVVPGAWAARGLVEVPSGPLRMRDVPARRVGAPGWYLERPGFHWGGIQVAACWYGGAVGLARTLLRAASRDGADRLLLMHLGAVDAGLDGARASLAEAALLVDRGRAEGEAGRLLAKRVRAVVARAVDDTLTHVAHALGPAPLAQDADHAKRVADLGLYVRQHHAERDDASLGGALAEAARRRAAEADATDTRDTGTSDPTIAAGPAPVAAAGVAFDAREPGTDADVWDADPRWDALDAPDIAGMAALLVVSAHADDESIGAAGLMATAAARGVPVTLAIVTDGAASHPGSPLARPTSSWPSAATRPAPPSTRSRPTPGSCSSGTPTAGSASAARPCATTSPCSSPTPRRARGSRLPGAATGTGTTASRARSSPSWWARCPPRVGSGSSSTRCGCGTGRRPTTRACRGPRCGPSRSTRAHGRPSGPRSARTPARWIRCPTPPRTPPSCSPGSSGTPTATARC
nr:PIG-L family deacetylase [Clavibacter michiganensis]